MQRPAWPFKDYTKLRRTPPEDDRQQTIQPAQASLRAPKPGSANEQVELDALAQMLRARIRQDQAALTRIGQRLRQLGEAA
jgi:hypothetical protein